MKKIAKWFVAARNTVLLYLLFHETDKKIRRLFSKLCALDLLEPIDIGPIKLFASGSTVEIVQENSHYAINEVQWGRIGVYRKCPITKECPEGWIQVYRSYEILKDMHWLKDLKLILDSLLAIDYFTIRNKELQAWIGNT